MMRRMGSNGSGQRGTPAGGSAGSGTTPSNPGARSSLSLLRVIAALGLIAAVVVLLGWLLSLVGTRVITIQVLIFAALMGVFPVSYITYVGFGREDAHRERLKNDFRLLGLASEDTLDETVSKLYQVVYNRWQYVAYITLITLVSLLVFAGYLRQDALPLVLAEGIVAPETMQLLFYAFLGAYVFTVQATVRRYNTLDLQPQVYSSMLVRILVALAIVFAGVKLIQAAGGSLVDTTGGEEAADAAAWATVLAFVIGAFPTVGFRWLLNLAGRTFTLPAVQSSERPLTYLIGMSTWHEARLQEIGIDDAQNLATADIRKLLLTTRFDTQTIVNWIDQAILYTRIGPKIDRFRDAHIETFFQFRQQLDEINAAEDGDEQRRLMAVALGLADGETLERVANSDNFPNYAHIVEYYSRVGDVVRERAKEGMTNVLGRVFRYDTVESVERAEEWLRTHPREVEMRLALGKAYYRLGKPDRAEACYREAVASSQDPAQQADAFASLSALAIDEAKYEQAIAEATQAIERYPYSTTAYNNRGLAYLLAGYPRQALDDLNRALELDDRYAEAYFNRGWLYLKEGNSGEALGNFYHTYLLGDRQNPALWHYWGEALFDPSSEAAVEAAIEKFSQAIRRADLSRDSHKDIRLWAYVRRGFAYMRQGAFGPAENDLKLVTSEADAERPQQREILVVAYINRGLLDAERGRHEGATNCYKRAIELDDTSVRAHYNLAVTYHRMQETEAARAAFQRVLELSEPRSSEYRDAERWMMRHATEQPREPAAAENGRPPAGDGQPPAADEQPPPAPPQPPDAQQPTDGPIA